VDSRNRESRTQSQARAPQPSAESNMRGVRDLGPVEDMAYEIPMANSGGPPRLVEASRFSHRARGGRARLARMVRVLRRRRPHLRILQLARVARLKDNAGMPVMPIRDVALCVGVDVCTLGCGNDCYPNWLTNLLRWRSVRLWSCGSFSIVGPPPQPTPSGSPLPSPPLPPPSLAPLLRLAQGKQTTLGWRQPDGENRATALEWFEDGTLGGSRG
jgi:hypothetical protein